MTKRSPRRKGMVVWVVKWKCDDTGSNAVDMAMTDDCPDPLMAKGYGELGFRVSHQRLETTLADELFPGLKVGIPSRRRVWSERVK